MTAPSRPSTRRRRCFAGAALQAPPLRQEKACAASGPSLRHQAVHISSRALARPHNGPPLHPPPHPRPRTPQPLTPPLPPRSFCEQAWRPRARGRATRVRRPSGGRHGRRPSCRRPSGDDARRPSAADAQVQQAEKELPAAAAAAPAADVAWEPLPPADAAAGESPGDGGELRPSLHHGFGVPTRPAWRSKHFSFPSGHIRVSLRRAPDSA